MRGGELIGLAAVEGNGQRRFLRTLAGLSPRPADWAVGGPLAFIPEDRTTEGLAPGFTLTENLVLGLGSDPRWIDGPWIRWPAARRRMAELIAEFEISASGPGVAARTLSGGNQQKLVFARAVEGDPAVVIAENPTRGLDIRATTFVHDRLRRLASDGALVVVYSTDLDEVLRLASRVMVMYRDGLREAPAGAVRAQVGAMMLGGDP
jgi:simple sugar transport system ATP-binding protein